MAYPSHVIAARKIICAVATSLAIKWFNPLMWSEDDPIEVKDKTAAMNVAAKSCIRLATTLRLAPISKIPVRKQDTFLRKYADDLLKLKEDRVLQSEKALALLEVANLTQCNVVCMTHDMREWDYLYKITRELLEDFFYPHFPDIEDKGMDLYFQMTHG